jgi:hypothetical protein
MLQTNSELDLETGFIYPNNSGTWSQLAGATWAAWTSWNNTPADPLIWVTDTIQVPYNTTYNLKIETLAQGAVSYEVYTSTTGAFEGEETTTTINAGATSVPSFSGNYVRVAIKVTNTGQPTLLQDTRITATDYTIDLLLNNIDTSSLAGTAGNRTLALPRSISGIINMSVSAQDVTAYTPNVYVTDIATTQFVTALVTDKTATAPKVGVFGIDGYPRDCVVDVRIRALPAGKMSGNNLVTE